MATHHSRCAFTISVSRHVAQARDETPLSGAQSPLSCDVARHHHERFDGHGYPDSLAHHDIPLSARIVAIADVYDALRSRRVYKQPIPHDVAVRTILEESIGQFDPALLQAFSRCAPDFDRIYSDAADEMEKSSSVSEKCRQLHRK